MAVKKLRFREIKQQIQEIIISVINYISTSFGDMKFIVLVSKAIEDPLKLQMVKITFQ